MDSRNAAIWYARDGYDPDKKGLNGRRVAGASFLKGFFRHADVGEIISLTQGDKGRKEFLTEKQKHNTKTPHRAIYERDLRALSSLGALYYPAPNYSEQLWKRQAVGMHNHSICGITHTTATQAVMRGMYELRAGPQAEWDGIICTSKAVHAATLRNMEVAEDLLRSRFGRLPPRPQMPVIPLGINCDDFAHDPKAARRLRKRMGWTKDDVAVVTIARLIPYGKFDPGPLFIALQKAQAKLGRTRRLHFIACGLFGDSHSQTVFRACAKELMPDVDFHHFAGDDPVARTETLSGGDIFTFPIDNVQETFGLAPIEAMAAGLPVVVSDWDGMRDTVTSDVGIRVPTQLASAKATGPEAQGYLSGALTYPQYGNRLSMITDVSVQKMSEAFVTLAKDAKLRKQMGKAGAKRAKTIYDWEAVIPQMQDFWAELARIRKRSADPKKTSFANPVAPLPGDLFASYPSEVFDHNVARYAFTATLEQIDVIFKIRRYDTLGQPAEKAETLKKCAKCLIENGGKKGMTLAEMTTRLSWNRLTIERCVLFFLKYDLATKQAG